MKKYSLLVLLMVSCITISAQKSYKYPFTHGDAKWRSFNSSRERIEALQIPENTLPEIPTKELLIICLDFPYLTDIAAFDSFDKGFDVVKKKFNGWSEFLKRHDKIDALIKYLNEQNPIVEVNLSKTDVEKGRVLFKHYVMINLLNLDFMKKQMSSSQLKESEILIKKIQQSISPNKYENVVPETNTPQGSIGQNAYSSVLPDLTEGDIIGVRQVAVRYTPNHSKLYVGELVVPDLNEYEKALYKYDAENNYGAIYVSEATLQYNCHAYAWHISQGHPNDLVWIGFDIDETIAKQRENIYWEDGSYIEVPEAIATHISYDEMSANHSALKYDSIRYISKWGAYPLVIHMPNETPYNTSQPKKFYCKAPKISGSSSLCDTHDYSIDNLPTGADVSWALSVNGSSTAAQLSVNTPAVHQCRITRSSSQSGSFSATLTATITYQNDTIKVLSKSLDGPAHFVSVPYTIINTVGSGGTGGMVGSYNNIDIKPNTMYYLSSSYFIGKTLTLQGSPIIGNYMFTPAGINGYYVMVPQDGNMIALLSDSCTTTTWSFWGHSYAYNMSISGGNGQLTVEITQGDSSSSENRGAGTQQKVPASKELPAWTLEVYEATTFKKMRSAEVNGNSRTFDTSSWPKGIYIVRAIVDKEILSEKITIQ